MNRSSAGQNLGPQSPPPNANGLAAYNPNYYGAPSPSNYGGFSPGLDTSPGFPPGPYQMSPLSPGTVANGYKSILGEARDNASTDLPEDPVSTHLLVENALFDSEKFSVLPFERVEMLKKEEARLQNRVMLIQKQLKYETKLRDSARNMYRLNAQNEDPAVLKSSVMTLLSPGNRTRTSQGPQNTIARYAEEVSKKVAAVEDLHKQLSSTVLALHDLQTQLLKHTARVLQMTHEGPSKRSLNASLRDRLSRDSARPDSPESIFTYHKDSSYLAALNANDFDDRSYYREKFDLDRIGERLNNAQRGMSEESLQQQRQELIDVERRLEQFNDLLRGSILQANPERQRDYAEPPKASLHLPEEERTSSLEDHLNYLEQGFQELTTEHGSVRDQAKHAQDAVEGRLEAINNQLRTLINQARRDSEDDYPPPPEMTGQSSQEQINYLEEALYVMEQQHKTRSDSTTEFELQEEFSKYKTALHELWNMIQAGEEERRERKRQRREQIQASPDAFGDEELSPDEESYNESFSLQAFTSKMQWIYRRLNSMKDQQVILRRQIKQQRELNSKSDAQREEQVEGLNEQLRQAREDYHKAEQELIQAMTEIEQMRDGVQQRARSDSMLESEQVARREAEDRIADLEAQLTNLQDDVRIAEAEHLAQVAEANQKAEAVAASLEAATVEKEAAEQRAAEAAQALEEKEKELREFEGEFIRVQTELTMARAELDGAYGSRAQRAAEVAANPEIQKELTELSERNMALQEEILALRATAETTSKAEAEARRNESIAKEQLKGLVEELEGLTEQGIREEKIRDDLDRMIDALKLEKDQMEMELNDARIALMGVRSPGPGMMTPVEATSIKMLREEFKKLMRDKTAEHIRNMRAADAERRKLESQLHALRKEQALGPHTKSTLGRSMTLPVS